jgi:choline dehydrogenase-like flavoprotein
VTHLAHRPAGEDVELEADYVVVGSGAGGGAAAIALARAGASVAVVEAGPWRDPEDYPSSAYGALRDVVDGWGGTVTRGRALWPIIQGRCAGGGTVINSAICVRTPEDVARSWVEAFGFRGDAYLERLGRHQDALEAELEVEAVPPASRGRSNDLALVGGRAAGHGGHVIRRYAKGCLGTGQCLQGCRAGKKRTVNVTWLPELRARGGTVLSCAPVQRIDLEGTRAVGVRGRFVHPATRARGARFRVRARRAVVVAASVTHTPRLLARSGVRSPALGAGFRAHPGSGVFGVYDDPVDMNRGATQGWASTALRTSHRLKLETLAIPPELVASRLAGVGRELVERFADYRHLAMWVQATRAEAVGRVSTGLFGQPVVRYELGRADMERFREGMYVVAQTHLAAGARAVIPGIQGLPYELGPDQIGRLREAPLDPRAYVAILSHLFGGAVMGTDPSRSVCDPHGRVHGYVGLGVADAAVIPSTLGVNPQHTIMALARMHAEALLEAEEGAGVERAALGLREHRLVS